MREFPPCYTLKATMSLCSTSAHMRKRPSVEKLRETTSFSTAGVLRGDVGLHQASGFAVEAILAPALSKYGMDVSAVLMINYLLVC